MEVKLIKVGPVQPNNQLHSYSKRKNVECPLDGDPSGWILTVDDLELASSAIKYHSWDLLEPESVQCPLIPNRDGHDKISDFFFERGPVAKAYLSKKTERTQELLARFEGGSKETEPEAPEQEQTEASPATAPRRKKIKNGQDNPPEAD